MPALRVQIPQVKRWIRGERHASPYEITDLYRRLIGISVKREHVVLGFMLFAEVFKCVGDSETLKCLTSPDPKKAAACRKGTKKEAACRKGMKSGRGRKAAACS